jgi:hypothetical protein
MDLKLFQKRNFIFTNRRIYFTTKLEHENTISTTV